MRLSERVKFECFMAFIHSRMVGKGVEKDTGVIIVEEEDKNLIENIGDTIIKKVGSISTSEDINTKCNTGISMTICDMYYHNYALLGKLMDNQLKKGDEVIQVLIGTGLLDIFISEKSIDIDISQDDLVKMVALFPEKDLEHREVIFKMQKVATYIYEGYWKPRKRKVKTQSKRGK